MFCFLAFTVTALLYSELKDEFKFENIHDKVLGKPDWWSRRVSIFLGLDHYRYVETVRFSPENIHTPPIKGFMFEPFDSSGHSSFGQ